MAEDGKWQNNGKWQTEADTNYESEADMSEAKINQCPNCGDENWHVFVDEGLYCHACKQLTKNPQVKYETEGKIEYGFITSIKSQMGMAWVRYWLPIEQIDNGVLELRTKSDSEMTPLENLTPCHYAPNDLVVQELAKIMANKRKLYGTEAVECDMKKMSSCEGEIFRLGLSNVFRCEKHIFLQRLWVDSSNSKLDLIDWMIQIGRHISVDIDEMKIGKDWRQP